MALDPDIHQPAVAAFMARAAVADVRSGQQRQFWSLRFDAIGFSISERHPSQIGRPVSIDGQQLPLPIRVLSLH